MGLWDTPPTDQELSQPTPDPWSTPPTEDELAAPAAPPPDDDARLRAIFDAGLTRAPDQHAGVLDLSKRLNVPAEVVEARYPEFQKAATAAEFDPVKFREQAPGTAAWLLGKPEAAPLVQDDTARLSGIEWALTGKNIGPEYDINGWPTGPSRWAPPAWHAAITNGLKEQRLVLAQTREFSGAGDDENRALIRQLEQETSADLGAESILAKAWTGAFRMMPMIGGATLSGLGGPLGMGAFFTYQHLGPAYWREAQKTDAAGEKHEGMARVYAAAQAPVLGAVEMMTFGPLLRFVPGASKALEKVGAMTIERAFASMGIRNILTKAAATYGTHYASAVAGEAVTGALEETASQIANVTSFDKDFEVGPIGEAAWNNLQTALTDMIFIAGFAPARELYTDLGRRAAEVESAERYQALVKGATESTLLQRAPEQFQELVRQVVAKGGAADTVYFPVEAWDAYWTAQKLDPREVARSLGEERRYDEAAVAKGDVAIAADVFLAKVAKSHGDALAQDVKLAQDALTFRQRDVLDRSLAKRIKAAAQAAPDKMEAGQRAVYEDYRNRVRLAGRDEAEARAAAVQVAGTFRGWAEQYGTTADELYRRTAKVSIEVAEESSPASMARAAQGASGVVKVDGEPVVARETGPGTTTVRGAEARVITPQRADGERAHYEVLEADELVPSHLADSFQPNPDYPAGVQEREYHRQPEEQMKVVQGGQRLDPAPLLTDTPSAVDGPPLVTTGSKRLVMGGNVRALMIKRGFRDEAALAKYREALLAKAQAFGLDPKAIGGMKAPVLVRVMDEVPHDAPQVDLVAAVRRTNEGMTQALSPRARSVAEAKNMSPETIRALGDLISGHDGTLRDLMRERPAQITAILRRDGIITPQNQSAWLQGANLTDEAKDRVEGMFLGRLVGSGDRMAATPPGVLQKLERVAPEMLRVQGVNPAMDEIPTLQAALDAMNDAAAHGMNIVALLTQTNLFDESTILPEVAAMARLITSSKPKELQARFKAWAELASFDPGQPTLFGAHPTREEARATLFAGKGDVSLMQAARATQTPEFQRWFGKSRVTRTVERTGETVPQRVYHSTEARFDVFEAGELGFHFGDKAAAKQIGGKRTVEAYLSIQNPLYMPRDVGVWGSPEHVIEALAQKRGLFSPEEVAALRDETNRLHETLKDQLSDEGYDRDALAYKKAQYEVTRPIREALIAKGYDGIEYRNEAEGFGTGWIAFRPEQIKSIFNRGTFDPADANILRQGTLSGAPLYALAPDRGSIRFGVDFPDGPKAYTITLGAGSDRSTLAHETFHMLVDVMHRLGTAPETPSDLRRDLETLSRWMGYASPEERLVLSRERVELSRQDEAGTLTSEGRKRLRELVAKEERATHGWEQYLAEGKAPSLEMAGVFRRFSNWMRSIYRSIENIGAQFRANYGEELGLTPEVRRVFDRLLARGEELERAEREVEAQPLPEVLAAMAPDEREKYEAAAARSRLEAEEELGRRMAEADRRENQAWFKAERDWTQAEVERELDKDPTYRALHYFLTGEAKEVPAWTAAELKDSDGRPLKLDRRALEERYGKAFVEGLPKGVLATKKTGEGVDADYVAERLGFVTGDEMLMAVRDAEPRASKVDSLTKERMIERFGPALADSPQAVTEAALGAVHNPARLAKVLMERRAFAEALAKLVAEGEAEHVLWTRYEPTVESIRANAQRILEEKPVGELSPKAFLRAERAAARDAMDAFRDGKHAKALEYKDAQLVNMELFRLAEEAKEEAEQTVAALRRFTDDNTRAKLGKLVTKDPVTGQQTQPYLEQVDRLLEGFELRASVSMREVDRRAETKAWLDREHAALRDPVIPDRILEKLERAVHWKTLTLPELRDLRDAVESVAHQAELKGTLLTSKGRREFEVVKAELIRALMENVGAHTVYRVLDNAPTSAKLAAVKRKALAVVERPEFLFERLDGGEHGPWHDAFWNVLSDSYNKYGDLRRELQRKIVEEVERLPASVKMRFKTETFTANGQPFMLEQVVALALNWGSKSNREKLVKGEMYVSGQGMTPMSEADMLAVIKRLPPEVVPVVNAIHRHLDSMWPEMEALEQRLVGLAPPKVKPKPWSVVNDQGVTLQFEGGYYPMIYDPQFAGAGARSAEQAGSPVGALAFDPGYMRGVTPQGHLQSRVEGYARPVYLSLDALPRHIDHVTKDVGMREALISIRDILTDPDIFNALNQTVGTEGIKQLQGVWRDSANELVIPDGGASLLVRGTNWLRSGITGSIFGLNVGQWMQNFTGLANLHDKVPGKYMRYGFWKVMHGRGDALEEVRGESSYVRGLSESMNRDIGEELRKLAGKAGKVARARESFLWLFQTSDKVVRYVGYLAAREHALAPKEKGGLGLSREDAVRHAEEVIRTSLAAGRVIDLPAYMRSKEIKLFTMFQGWANSQVNQLVRASRESGTEWSEGRRYRAVRRLMKHVTYLGIATVLSQLLTGKAPEDDDEEEGVTLGDWAKWGATRTALAPLTALPVVGEGVRLLDTGRASSVPWMRPVEASAKAVGGAWRLGETYLEEGEVDPEELSRQAALTLQATGYLTGLPVAQLTTTSGYLANREGDEGPVEDVLGVAFGKKRPGKLISVLAGEE